MAKYVGDFTPNQITELKYLENAMKRCKMNLDSVVEKIKSTKKGKTKAHQVEEERNKEDYDRYMRQLQNLEKNMTDILEARERYEYDLEQAEKYVADAEELDKKYEFSKCAKN